MVFKLDLRASKGYAWKKVDMPSRSFGAVATIIWTQTRDPGDPRNAKDDKAVNTDCTHRQSWRLYLRFNNCQFYANMTKLWDYSIGIAQIDDEIEVKLNFWICPKSTISLLVSSSVMPEMRCFSIHGVKKQHYAILDLFGITEEIIMSLARLPSTTYSLLFRSSLLLLKYWIFLFSLLFSIFEFIAGQILS